MKTIRIANTTFNELKKQRDKLKKINNRVSYSVVIQMLLEYKYENIIWDIAREELNNEK